MVIALLVGRDDEERRSLAWFIDAWRQALLAHNSELEIRIYPEVGDPEEIDLLLVWNHPIGVIKKFPNIKLIYSLAAGVDHVFVDQDVDATIPIVRVIDPFMAGDLVQYVVAYVLKHVKLLDHWAAKQKQKEWFKYPPFSLADKTIGIMGMGFLGSKAAHIFKELGLKVLGWSQTQKNLDGIKHFVGQAEFEKFLTQTDTLICMLPLTSKTENIINKHTLSLLPQDAYIVNVGRGQHVVDEDLLAAINSGHISGATLDVFRTEPLPIDHPFWTHPKINVTPHVASVTNALTAAPQVYDNYQRLLAGKELLNRVDIKKGY